MWNWKSRCPPEPLWARIIRMQNNEILAAVDQIQRKLQKILQEDATMAATLDELIAEVQRNNEVDQSAIVLIKGIAEQLEASKTDPVKVAELAASLRASTDALAAAVVANTPSA